ncbi:hypothetical protein CTRI78_v009455 [Colletotrichum trifolii]|uniref:Uncharacterized protein n=1 Tax=Colletotrichum trifolii TaxID=5466 RepID=A0A4R8QQN3_COLTR|nr:hypothetical protein CTRI78_v009455 [Colletotrichum trifolii]
MTQPPPSTPTPRRFPFSKRPPPSAQKTPGSGAPGFASSQRFHATPRFAPPSSSRVPPSTPAFPGSIRSSRKVDPIHDALDSSQDAPPTVTRPRAGPGTQKEVIDSDSEFASDSQDDEPLLPPPRRATGVPVHDSIEIESSDTQSDGAQRTPKRRRISISPAQSSMSVFAEDKHADNVKREPVGEDNGLSDVDGRILAGDDHDLDEDMGIPDPGVGETSKTQPTFHRAPRFKVSEAELARTEGLPDAFSPQRRGQRYVPGGLAAEMQSWLAEVKGWAGGGDRAPDLVMQIAVDGVVPGNRMYLVNGRRIVEGEESTVDRGELCLDLAASVGG